MVRNQATQIVNDLHKATNVATNPVKPLNPAKDVAVTGVEEALMVAVSTVTDSFSTVWTPVCYRPDVPICR